MATQMNGKDGVQGIIPQLMENPPGALLEVLGPKERRKFMDVARKQRHNINIYVYAERVW